MPLFADRKIVREFEYQQVFVQIFTALMGAAHCRIDHAPEKKRCDKCGKPIRAIKVHIIAVFGKDLETFVNISDDQAERLAKQMIDDVVSRLPDLDPDGKNGDDEPDVPGFPGLDLPGAGDDDRGGGRKKGDNPLAPVDKTIKLGERMKKLGWPTRAAQIIREELAKQKKGGKN